MGKEILYEDLYILSETDEKGNITFAGDSFCSIARYEREELIGKPHNIVRHPDMPRAAFKMLWDSIKTKGYWTGIVKNLAKNGDYYWVKATVLKSNRNGHTSYFSIRIKPTREEVKAAEELYKTLH